MIGTTDFAPIRVLQAPEYFVYCGACKMKKWGKRCVQIAKGQFFVMLNKKSATHLSASTDKLGCTLLSKRDKPNRYGRLSDLWQG
jgi:hypothetical protein